MIPMNKHLDTGRRTRGSASVIALLVVVTMLGVSGAVLAVGMRGQNERSGVVADEQAVHTARAGVGHVVANLTVGDTGMVGTADAPVEFGNGNYWASIVDLGEGRFDPRLDPAHRLGNGVVATIVGEVGDEGQVEAVVASLLGAQWFHQLQAASPGVEDLVDPGP